MILCIDKKKMYGLEGDPSMLSEFSLTIRRHFSPQKKIAQLQVPKLDYQGDQAVNDRNVDTIHFLQIGLTQQIYK